MGEAESGEVFYATLLRFAGCAATSHEIAQGLGGDDVAVRAGGDLVDPTEPGAMAALLAALGIDAGTLTALGGVRWIGRLYAEGARADCEVGAGLTRRLHLPSTVTRAVSEGLERWDGHGAPAGLAGEDIAVPARVAAVAFAAVMFDAVGGRDAAVAAVTRWSGRALEPALADVFLEDAGELLALSDPDDVWAAAVAAEPQPRRLFRNDAALDDALAGFGDAADLKTPWFHGHSGGVAGLARDAAQLLGSVDPVMLHRAALLHDLGRVAVPTGIWERPGRLRPQDWELVRLHPYQSARILARSPVLAPLANVVGRHHERLDSSGYPSGVGAAELDHAAGLLAAADVLHALTEPRPHRAALDLAAAAGVMGDLPLRREEISAVLAAADAPRPAFAPLPAELTARELDVLKLLADGLTKQAIADRLHVSYSTVHTHTVHIYAKCQVSTRAGLAMFAMRHGLLTR